MSRKWEAPGASWRAAAETPTTRGEVLNRAFTSPLAMAASPLSKASPLWASRQAPPTPLDAAREEKYREEAMRLLQGNGGDPSPPRAAACDEWADDAGGHSGEGAKMAHGGDETAAPGRKRVNYRQPTTAHVLRAGGGEHPLPVKRMSAESKVAAYENRLQDQQTLIKTLRTNEQAAKEAQAAAVVALEALRKEMREAMGGKDADLEALRLEHEALLVAHDSLKISLKRTKAEESARQTDELKTLHEQLKSTSKIIAALSAKVEHQRGQVAELETRCQTAEGKAERLQVELAHWQEQHQDVQVSTDSQITHSKKQLNLARDQMALNVARTSAVEKAWLEKQERLEQDLVASARKNKEQKALVQTREKELASLKEEMLKKLWKPDVATKGIQTDEWPNRWLWLLTLKIAVMSDRDLQHEKECQTDTVRIEGMPTGKARVATRTTQTAVDSKEEKATEEEVWWIEMLSRVNSFQGYLESSNGAQSMPEGQILSLISALYAEKCIADYQDAKQKRPLQPLQEFAWGYLLRDTGDKAKAEKLLVRFLANILWRTSFHKKSAAARNNPVVAEKFLRFRHRYCLFLRFLGFSVIDNDGHERAPITTYGMDVFLQMLVRMRRGACPLLEASTRQILVPMVSFFDAIDFVFSSSKSFERERIKTEVADFFRRAGGDETLEDEMDLESGLELALKEYDEIAKRWDTRLEAVFAANDTDGDGNLDLSEFQGMMKKLSENSANSAEDTVAQIRMYANMCMWPRVDATIFIKVAKKYRVCFFTPGEGYQPPKTEFMDNERMCQRLVPLHKASSESIIECLEGIQHHPHGQDLLQKWTLCEQLMIARKDPMVAWVIFHQATRLFSTIQGQLRDVALQISMQTDENGVDGLTPAEKRNRMLSKHAFKASEGLLETSSVAAPSMSRKKAFSATMGAKAMTRLVKESHNPVMSSSSSCLFAEAEHAAAASAALTPAEKRQRMFGKGFSATDSGRNGLFKRAPSVEAPVSPSATAEASAGISMATSTSPDFTRAESGFGVKASPADTVQKQGALGAAEGRGRDRAQTNSTTRNNKSHSPSNRGQVNTASQSRAMGRSVSPPREGTSTSARAARQKNQKISSAWTAAPSTDACEAGREVAARAPAAAGGVRGEYVGSLQAAGIDGRPKSPTRPLSPVRGPARRTSPPISRTSSSDQNDATQHAVHFSADTGADSFDRSSSAFSRPSRIKRTSSASKPMSSFSPPPPPPSNDALPPVGV